MCRLVNCKLSTSVPKILKFLAKKLSDFSDQVRFGLPLQHRS